MSRGKFITLEGGEGMGKSSCLGTVLDVLRERDISVVATREPGGTALGEKLRGVLLDPDVPAITVDAELLLMFAARAEHIARVIEPALAAGQWVVSDRFTDASFAYQGGGRGVPVKRIEMLESWVQGSLQPNLTLLFDAAVEVGMQRVGERGERDRFERENLDFYNRVRQAYLARASRFPGRFFTVAADRPLESVQTSVRERILKLAHSASVS